MAAPTLPVPILGAFIGLAGFLVYKIVKSIATPFSTSPSGVQSWHESEANALRAELAASHLTPHPAAERVWIVVPGAVPAPDALAAIKAIQAQMHLVTSSTNLLDRSAAQRLVAEVLPAEQATLATGTELAVLPAL